MKNNIKKILDKIKMIALKRAYDKKITNLLNNKQKSNLKNEEVIKIQNFWKKYFLKPINIKWHKYYINFNSFDEKYIPEDLFYGIIEKKFNGYRQIITTFEDKNYYDLLYSKFDKPKSLLKNINGIFYDESMKILEQDEVLNYLNNLEGEFIIKPSLDTSGAKNVRKINIKTKEILMNKKVYNWEQILSLYRKDFLIQELVKQSKEINKIYPNSLNTLRFMTYRKGKEFDILSVIIRIGANGAEVDNLVKGGFGVGINKITGKLNDFGVDKNGKIINKIHPETKYTFADFQIPNWNYIVSKIEEWSFDIPDYFKLCSWDIGLDENNNPIFIECNLCGQEINFHQVNNGPLFGDKTEHYLNELSGE